MKSFLGNCYRHLAIFIWSHCLQQPIRLFHFDILAYLCNSKICSSDRFQNVTCSHFEMTWSCPIFSFSLLSERSFCRRAIASGDWYSSYLPTTVHSKVPTRYRNIYKNVCQGWTFVQNIILFIFKWANTGLFCLFSSSSSHYNFNSTNWKKHRWCAWDSNPRPQNGRCRQYHGARPCLLTRLDLLTVSYAVSN